MKTKANKIIRNMKIRTKLFLGFSILLVLILALGLQVIAGSRNINSEYSYVLSYIFDRYSLINEIGMYFMDIRRITNRVALYANDSVDPVSSIASQESAALQTHENMNSAIDALKTSVIQDERLSSEEKFEIVGEIETFERAVDDFVNVSFSAVIESARTLDISQTIREVRQARLIADDIFVIFGVIKDVTSESMYGMSAQFEEHAQTAYLVFSVATVITIITGLTIAVFVSKAIIKPIKRGAYALCALKKGDIDVILDDNDFSRDEMGELLRDIQDVVDRLRSVNDEVRGITDAAVNKGDLKYEVDTRRYSGKWNEILMGLNKIAAAVDAPIVEIRGVVEAISNGDFSQKVTGDYEGDFLKIKKAVNQTANKLAKYVGNEIAKEMELEKQLYEQNFAERIAMIYDATPLIIEFWSKDYVLLDCNKTTLKFHGVDDKQVYLDNFRSYYVSDSDSGKNQVWKENVDKAFSGEHVLFDFDLQRPNGEIRSLNVHAESMIFDSETVVVIYAQDVTDVKKLQNDHKLKEIAEATSRAKSEFLARMSHEIRTPLTAIMGISEIELKKTDLTSRTEESLATIFNSSSNLLSIINDILDISKIDEGKVEVVEDEYEIASMIVDVSYLHKTMLENKNIVFDLDLDSNLPSKLSGDVVRVGQIVKNLLSNAFKYTESGRVELSVKCEYDIMRNDDVELVIKVSDTGYGMTEEQVNALGKDYIRYHEKVDRTISGTGLGMAIVFNLVHIMKGSLKINSKVGKGTQITVKIPQRALSNEVLSKELVESLKKFELGIKIAEKKLAFTPISMPYGKVLIVDDVSTNLYVARGLLSFYDIDVTTCLSGKEALNLISSGNKYDVVFLDHMMPMMSGVEVLERLRAMGYLEPVIALTANALVGQAEKYAQLGFDGFISKPIQTKHLDKILKQYVRDKQPEEVLAKVKQQEKNETLNDENIQNFLTNSKTLKNLRKNFVRTHKDAYCELVELLNAEDFDKAHRLVHTLKGSSAVIGANELTDASLKIESRIIERIIPSERLLIRFRSALSRLLAAINEDRSYDKKRRSILDKFKSLELLDEIEPLLATYNSQCIDLLDDVSAIEGSEKLCEYIEMFDFDSALEILNDLRNSINE